MAAGKKRTHSEYVSLLEKANPSIKVLGVYHNYHTPINHKCVVCSHEWKAQPANLMNGKGCPECGKERTRAAKIKPPSDYLKILESKGITLTGKYSTLRTKTDHLCNTCGHVWNAQPQSIKLSSGCPKCAGNLRLTHDEYISGLKDKPFKIISEYSGADRLIKAQCNICSCVWETSANNIRKRGSGCPACAGYGFNKGKPGFLYMLLSNDNRLLKIGITNYPDKRHIQLAKHTPFEWSVIYQIKADGMKIYELEQSYHQSFASYRAEFADKFDGYTEWFNFTGAVKSIISRLLANTQEAA